MFLLLPIFWDFYPVKFLDLHDFCENCVKRPEYL